MEIPGQLSAMERFKRGITLTELLIVIGILVILATVSFLKFREWYEVYEYMEEVSRLEYAIRKAKVIALERSSYVKVSANGNTLTVEDCGWANDSCSTLESINFKYTLSSTGDVIFSPRGLAYSNGSFCVSYRDMSYKVIVNRGGIRVEKGGTC